MDYEARFDYTGGRRRRTEDDPFPEDMPPPMPAPTRISQMPLGGSTINVGGVDFQVGPLRPNQDYANMRGGLDEYGLPVPVPGMWATNAAHDINDPNAALADAELDRFSREYQNYNAMRAQRQASTPIPGAPSEAPWVQDQPGGPYSNEDVPRLPDGTPARPVTLGLAGPPAAAPAPTPPSPMLRGAENYAANMATFGYTPEEIAARQRLDALEPQAAAPADTSFGAQYRGIVEDFDLAEQGRVREAGRTAPDAEGNSVPMSRPVVTPNGRISFVQVGDGEVWIYNHDRQDFERDWKDDPKWRLFRRPR